VRAAEAAHTEETLQALMGQLQESKGELEARAADLALKQSTLERSAAGLADLEATLATLSSTASAQAAEEVDVLVDLQNTLASRQVEVEAGSAEMGKTAKQVRGSVLAVDALHLTFAAAGRKFFCSIHDV
jgi:chromosome segregation ATPase